MSNILKLIPFHSDKVWGYEDWILSTHRNGESRIENKDITLKEFIKKKLSIIIKIIKAEDNLSVQVHPDDSYAKKYENDNGKTECWYILDAKKDAKLICGLKEKMNRDGLKEIIDNNNIDQYFNIIPVKKGDMIYIPSGTVHAIMGGIKLLEIQQSSDVTYRIYDWGRDREIHIDKSLDVINYNMDNNFGKIDNFKILETPHFTVEKINIDKKYKTKTNQEPEYITVINGSGQIFSDDEIIYLKEEDSIYINDNTSYEISGYLSIIKSFKK